MTELTRERLNGLSDFLFDRIGRPCEEGADAGGVESMRRTVRHAVTGIDAYLAATEAGSAIAVHLRDQAAELWESLEGIAESWAYAPGPGTAAGLPTAERAAADTVT
ncbi:hypothetical protein [Streptomyces sp. CB01881]|uniref:hypothetical protein n=1 Tax=Streptomyces sp. CB01881 TaxID=2078691 RepID=UPI001386CAC4|nr:hypothetical protein [Streptomyces sp. CB01881]